MHVPEVVCGAGEEANLARGLPSPNTADTQRNSGIRVDASATQIVWTLSRKIATNFLHLRSNTEEKHVVPIVSIMGPCGRQEAQRVFAMLAVKS